MNSIVKKVINDFPNLESCFLLDRSTSNDPAQNLKSDLLKPWIIWALETTTDFNQTRIHLNDSSHLMMKRVGQDSILVVHNKEENATMLMNFLSDLKSEDANETEKRPIEKQEISDPQVDTKMMDAVRIQKLIIPKQEDIKKEFKNFFVVHQQQDIVGGDFYWHARKGDNVLLAIVDCTGHSVEGAMTSMVVNSLLNQALSDFDPDNLIKFLSSFYNQIINYNKTSSEVNDYGMGAEIGLFNFNYKKGTVSFCSTGISAFIKRENGIEHLKSRKIIDYTNIEQSISEISFKMEGIKGIYSCTDGLTDLFDSKDKKKLGRRGILKMIEEEQHFNAEYYLSQINKWKGDNMQYDDITLIGVAI